MNRLVRLLALVAEGALITTLGCFLLVLPLLKLNVGWVGEEMEGVLLGFLPACVAGWWLFRRLRSNYAPPEAAGAAIAFSIFALAGLAVGVFLGEISGSYAEGFLGTPFLGAMVGIMVTIVILTFPPVLLTLWITRRIGRARHTQ